MSRLPAARSVVPLSVTQAVQQASNTLLPNAFKLRMLAGSSHLLRKSVQTSSDAKYQRDWTKWCAFLRLFENVDQDSDNVRFMLAKSQRSQLETLGSFMYHLAVDCKLKAATIRGTLSGVRHFFKCNYLPMEIFAHPSIRAVKQGLALEERQLSDYCPPKKKLPLTTTMVRRILDQAGIACDIRSKMVSTAVTMAFFCLLRVSEYVPKYQVRAATATTPAVYELSEEGDRCHAIMSRDVLFEVQSELPGVAAEFVPAHHVAADMWHRITCVKITLRSAKNDVMRAGSTFWFNNLSTTQYINIVRVLFDWSVLAHHRAGDFFMSYNLFQGRSCTNVPLSYNCVNQAMKQCAAEYGLDPRDFGTHSARIGGATALRAAGASESMVQRLGRWLDSRCALEYPATSFKEFDMMQLFLQASDNYTVRDLQLQATPWASTHRATPSRI